MRAWLRRNWRGVLGALVTVVALASLVNTQDPLGLLPLVQAAAPLLALGALLAALVMLRASTSTRGVLPALAALLSAVILAAPLFPDVANRHPTEPAPPGAHSPGTLTVLSSNTLAGSEDPAWTLSAVRQLRPDVLVLVEESPTHWNALLAGGLKQELPYATGSVGGSEATVVATREPMTCVELPGPVRCNEVVDVGTADAPFHEYPGGMPDGFHSPAVRLSDGTLFRGVHLWSPRLPPLSHWYSDQRGMADWVSSWPEERVILAGDFNASRSHPAFRELIEGMVQAPGGKLPWTRTWPYGWPVPPFVQIDHVVARGFDVVSAGVIDAQNSDHAAVWAQLRPK